MQVAINKASLGHILVAATASGVAAILIGDNEETLKRDLQTRFPNAPADTGQASVDTADAAFKNLNAKVLKAIQNPGDAHDIPLDLHGTPFQKRVWAALRQIPSGTTTTYAHIAQQTGNPKATRAVGTAIGANPVAILVPCHRVIRTDGTLGGYHWGIEHKQELLAREKQQTTKPRPDNRRAKTTKLPLALSPHARINPEWAMLDELRFARSSSTIVRILRRE